MLRNIACLLLLFGAGGCDLPIGPNCYASQCSMVVATTAERTIVGEDVEFTIHLAAKRPYNPLLFQDRLCNLTFIGGNSNRDYLVGQRYCVKSKYSRRNKTVSLSGFEDTKRTTYAIAELKRETIGPNGVVDFKVLGKTSISEDGLFTVFFADDVYFTFFEDAIVTVWLRGYRDNFYDDEPPAFLSYLQVKIEELDSSKYELQFYPVTATGERIGGV